MCTHIVLPQIAFVNPFLKFSSFHGIFALDFLCCAVYNNHEKR
nr:MAG TPA: hypothetical protein [Caudoviricetes sp.]